MEAHINKDKESEKTEEKSKKDSEKSQAEPTIVSTNNTV